MKPLTLGTTRILSTLLMDYILQVSSEATRVDCDAERNTILPLTVQVCSALWALCTPAEQTTIIARLSAVADAPADVVRHRIGFILDDGAESFLKAAAMLEAEARNA